MNLARVEYYLSDVLSVIETRDFSEGEIVTVPLVSKNIYGTDTKALETYGELMLPENLYIVGTVNMDETTFPFSRKVLDRANTIEFSYVNLVPDFSLSGEEQIDTLEIENDFLKAKYLLLQQCSHHSEEVQKICLELERINKILQPANAHVGYRIRDEIVFYLLNNKEENLISYEEALDNEIMQKILPRIQGSSASIQQMLCELFKLCASDYGSYQAEDNRNSDKMDKVIKQGKCKYQKSAEKIKLMLRRYEEDGFTQYWL